MWHSLPLSYLFHCRLLEFLINRVVVSDSLVSLHLLSFYIIHLSVCMFLSLFLQYQWHAWMGFYQSFDSFERRKAQLMQRGMCDTGACSKANCKQNLSSPIPGMTLSIYSISFTLTRRRDLSCLTVLAENCNYFLPSCHLVPLLRMTPFGFMEKFYGSRNWSFPGSRRWRFGDPSLHHFWLIHLCGRWWTDEWTDRISLTKTIAAPAVAHRKDCYNLNEKNKK